MRKEAAGMRYIFVCMASSCHILYDNNEVRVVGQDCVYPMWLLKYELPADS